MGTLGHQRQRQLVQPYQQHHTRYPDTGGLRHQIFLGGDDFVESFVKTKLNPKVLREFPRTQRKALIKSLVLFEGKYNDRGEAMAQAYLSGAYTYAGDSRSFSCTLCDRQSCRTQS